MQTTWCRKFCSGKGMNKRGTRRHCVFLRAVVPACPNEGRWFKNKIKKLPK